jgi:hypothetical protein
LYRFLPIAAGRPGPLHLELLGLVVDLNRVVLTITADPSGGLLGELLCSLAGGGSLQQIVDLLNQILAILQTVGNARPPHPVGYDNGIEQQPQWVRRYP